MKRLVQAGLQRLLGFQNYLYYFSRFKSAMLRFDRKEGDFNYFLQLLKEDAVVLDIGANIGIMTVPLCRKVKHGHVYAFEPIPANLQTLKKVTSEAAITNVTLFDYALGNENKETTMVLPVVGATKMQGLAHVVDKSITEFNEGELFSVVQKKLDDIEALKNKRIDAIKIDVENFEFAVFLGAQQLLTQYKPVIYCELWDNENRYNCFKLLKELGYSIYVLKHNTLLPYETNKIHTQNFFFVPVK